MGADNYKIEVNPAEYKILIVDDVPSNVLLLKALLKPRAYTVITAFDGHEALKKVESESPDLVLLDVMMPGMSGYEVAAKLKNSAEHHDIPILFITALNSHEEIVKGFQLGANDFISKPFNNDELLIRISHQISLIEAKRIILRQTEELKSIIMGRDKLYSVIAHDLRGPLGTIKMLLNVMMASLAAGQPVDEDSMEMLSAANKTTEEVFALLDNLLKWTKSQLGKLNVASQVFDIRDIVNDGIEVFRSMAESKGITIRLDDPVSCDVTLDPDMIKTVVRNLISNAVKFSEPGSEIHVGIDAGTDEKMVVVAVRDFGRGIPEENQQKLLRTNTHYSSFGTQNEDGAGLGLLLCDDFVRKNGGRLWFESKAGEGSTFFFSVAKG